MLLDLPGRTVPEHEDLAAALTGGGLVVAAGLMVGRLVLGRSARWLTVAAAATAAACSGVACLLLPL